MAYVLGAGAIGSLIAACTPGCRLLMRPSRLEVFLKSPSIRLSGVLDIDEPVQALAKPEGPVELLVVTTKAHQTVQAVREVLPFLSGSSTILLLQNGMGQAGMLKRLFTAEPPKIVCGITSSGVSHTPLHFSYNIAGLAPVYVDEATPKSFRINHIDLERIPRARLKAMQYEKLVVNACINPLTGLVECKNGQLLELDWGMKTALMVVKESASIVLAYTKKYEPAVYSHLSLRFDIDVLLKRVRSVCENTYENTSSMLSDVQAGVPTEIDFINGHLCRLAPKVALSAKVNEMLVDLIKTKTLNVERDLQTFVPKQ